MSIRALAVDLYKSQQKVTQLEKKLEQAPPSEHIHLEQELKFARQELAMLRKMLDGEKENSSFRKKFR